MVAVDRLFRGSYFLHHRHVRNISQFLPDYTMQHRGESNLHARLSENLKSHLLSSSETGGNKIFNQDNIKIYLREMGVEGCAVAGSCEDGNETSTSVKATEFLDELNDYQLIKYSLLHRAS
jgi:hypothetical protein